MSAVRVDEHTVYVRPDQANAFDILDFAHAAMRAFGWRQGPRQGSLTEIEQHGTSLHDAIGYACEKLSEESTRPEDRSYRGTSSKDWSVRTSGGEFENLRASATEYVQKQLPQGENDVTFNDKAKSVDEVLDVLGKARDEARKESGE